MYSNLYITCTLGVGKGQLVNLFLLALANNVFLVPFVLF